MPDTGAASRQPRGSYGDHLPGPTSVCCDWPPLAGGRSRDLYGACRQQEEACGALERGSEVVRETADVIKCDMSRGGRFGVGTMEWWSRRSRLRPRFKPSMVRAARLLQLMRPGDECLRMGRTRGSDGQPGLGRHGSQQRKCGNSLCGIDEGVAKQVETNCCLGTSRTRAWPCQVGSGLSCQLARIRSALMLLGDARCRPDDGVLGGPPQHLQILRRC